MPKRESRTVRCSCPPPRKVVAIGLCFAAGVGYVLDRDPECPIHKEPDRAA